MLEVIITLLVFWLIFCVVLWLKVPSLIEAVWRAVVTLSVAMWDYVKALPMWIVCVVTGNHDWRDGYDFCLRCGKRR